MKPKQYSQPAKQQRPRSKRKATDSAVRDAYLANKTQHSPTSSTSASANFSSYGDKAILFVFSAARSKITLK